MKRIVSLLMMFLLVLTGCNVDKAKIKDIDIKNLEYLTGEFITFDVSVSPNNFENAKVYLVSKTNYDTEMYGNALHEFSEKLPDAKFTIPYGEYSSEMYYLFVTVKGKNLEDYTSEIVEIDLTRSEPTLTVEVINNFTESVSIKFNNIENDLSSVKYCMISSSSETCEDGVVISDLNSSFSIEKKGNNYLLVDVIDNIGNNKKLIIDLTLE